MEVILLGIYGFFVWLIFYKFKWLPMNFTAAVITITLPIVAMMALFLLLNIAAPATDDVRAMNYVIPIVPRITGQVTEVPIQPNRPIKTGGTMMNANHAMTPATESSVSPWRNEAWACDGSARNVKAMNRTKCLQQGRRDWAWERMSECFGFMAY